MSQPLGTLIKAMDVLDALGELAPIGVLELARQLEMDKSAVSRILITFRSRGYVRITEDGRYDIGLRLYEMGQVIQERMPFREMIIPHVDALSRETGETVFAIHYDQGKIAYLYNRVSTQDIRLGERVGSRVSPWNHVAGKVILAHHEEAEVIDALTTLRRIQRKGLPTTDSLRRELTKIRKQGYAVERDAEKILLAVPILKEAGRVSAALMLGGPAFRIASSQTKPLAKLFIQHANKISNSLGWT